jgi:hypothetical protein
MHRVFRDPGATVTEADGPAVLREFLCSLGLEEEPSGGSYLYYCHDTSGHRRQLATLSGSPRRATVYLYPDALGLAPGPAEPFYRALDQAGVQLGAKLGPSIGIDLLDAAQLELFCEGMARLMGTQAAHAV